MKIVIPDIPYEKFNEFYKFFVSVKSAIHNYYAASFHTHPLFPSNQEITEFNNNLDNIQYQNYTIGCITLHDVKIEKVEIVAGNEFILLNNNYVPSDSSLTIHYTERNGPREVGVEIG